MAKVPLLFLHVRASVSGVPFVDDLDALRADLLAVAAKYAETYGVRIKRRAITGVQAAALMTVYEKRAAKTASR